LLTFPQFEGVIAVAGKTGRLGCLSCRALDGRQPKRNWTVYRDERRASSFESAL